MAIAVSYQRAISTRNRHPNPGASPCNPWSFPQTKTREKKTLNPSQTERQRDRETERQREIKAQPITKDKSHLRLHNGRFNPDSIPIQFESHWNETQNQQRWTEENCELPGRRFASGSHPVSRRSPYQSHAIRQGLDWLKHFSCYRTIAIDKNYQMPTVDVIER